MTASAQTPVTVVDLLAPGPERRRESVEAAIRAVLEKLPGGAWLVTLRPPAFPDASVSVFVRTSHGVVATRLPPRVTEEEIRALLARGTLES